MAKLKIKKRWPILNRSGETIGQEILTEDHQLWYQYYRGIGHTMTGPSATVEGDFIQVPERPDAY